VIRYSEYSLASQSKMVFNRSRQELRSHSCSLVTRELYFTLEAMVLKHILDKVCLDGLGLFSGLLCELEPDIEADGHIVAAAVEYSYSSDLIGVRYLFGHQVSDDLLPYLVVQFVDEVIRQYAAKLGAFFIHWIFPLRLYSTLENGECTDALLRWFALLCDCEDRHLVVSLFVKVLFQ